MRKIAFFSNGAKCLFMHLKDRKNAVVNRAAEH
jgi:hypothetical protein